MKRKNEEPMIRLAQMIKDLIKEAKEEYAYLAEVKTGYPNLSVKFGDMVLEKENLKLPGHLKDLLDRKPAFENGYTFSLNPGDTVLLINVKGIFYIIDKVEGI